MKGALKNQLVLWGSCDREGQERRRTVATSIEKGGDWGETGGWDPEKSSLRG